MYNIGQADNLLTAGSVAMPKYDIGSLSQDQYPCEYAPPDYSERPQFVPLGQPIVEYKENYVENTQHKRSGELSDKTILLSTLAFLVLLIVFNFVF